jgi:hypothetical protein
MLREMAPDERPREKLKLRGPAALSDGDLLAIILNTGVGRVTRRLPSLAGCQRTRATIDNQRQDGLWETGYT